MTAWQSVSLIWDRSPVWRVEIVWIIIAIVASVSLVTWFVTALVGAVRLRNRTIRWYPDNVAVEIARLDARISELETDNEWLTGANRQLRRIVKVVREAVITEPMRQLSEEIPPVRKGQ